MKEMGEVAEWMPPGQREAFEKLVMGLEERVAALEAAVERLVKGRAVLQEAAKTLIPLGERK